MFSMATFSLSSFCIMTFPLEMIEDKKIDGLKIYSKHLYLQVITMQESNETHVHVLSSHYRIIFNRCFYKGVEMSAGEWIGSGLMLWVGSSMFYQWAFSYLK